MKKIIIALGLLAVFSQPLSALALTLTNQDVSGAVKITSKYSENSLNLQIRSLAGLYTDDELGDYRAQLKEQELTGSGFFVTYSGCALTTKHVVYDEAAGSAHQEIYLWSADQIDEAPKNLGKAAIVYMRTLDDIAVVCLTNTGGKFFNRLFVKTPDYEDLTLFLGEEIYTLGYPVNGGEFITLTKGIAAGAWDDHTVKTDMAITSGGSGSAVLNGHKQVIGIAQGNTGPFDQLGLFLDPSFVINWQEGYQQVYRELLSNESAGCTNAVIRGVYQKQEHEYYDLACVQKRNIGLEQKIASDYKNICRADLRAEDAAAAAEYISSGKSTLENWQAYLEATCLGWPAGPALLFAARASQPPESNE